MEQKPSLGRARGLVIYHPVALCLKLQLKLGTQDFPGGAVVKNPPTNAGDMGSSTGLGSSHMLRSNKARAPQLLSPHATTTEAHVPRAHAPQQEKPPQ